MDSNPNKQSLNDNGNIYTKPCVVDGFKHLWFVVYEYQ